MYICTYLVGWLLMLVFLYKQTLWPLLLLGSCGWRYNGVGLFSQVKLKPGFPSGVWSSLLALHMRTVALV